MHSPTEFAPPDQDKQFARAFSLMGEAIGQRAFPGAALAVTHRGKLIALQAFGRFTYEDDASQVQAGTVFDIASLTKVVATTAVAMLLHERGKLALDEPIAKTLPDFVALGPKEQRRDREVVTVRMLLAHSSGLPGYVKLFQESDAREALVQAATATPLTAAPGTRAEYSDIGFILLGELLSAKANAPLDVFARQQVFAPLAMTRTTFNPPPDQRAEIPPTEDDRTWRRRIIQGEVNDENAYVMGGVAAHAGLFAPAADIARFAECMLGGGSPILAPETITLFTARQISSRALGWDTPSRPQSSSGKLFSNRSFGHLGFTGTSLWIDPERQLSVTLLTNRTWPDRGSQVIRKVRPSIHDSIVEAIE